MPSTNMMIYYVKNETIKYNAESLADRSHDEDDGLDNLLIRELH